MQRIVIDLDDTDVVILQNNQAVIQPKTIEKIVQDITKQIRIYEDREDVYGHTDYTCFCFKCRSITTSFYKNRVIHCTDCEFPK